MISTNNPFVAAWLPRRHAYWSTRNCFVTTVVCFAIFACATFLNPWKASQVSSEDIKQYDIKSTQVHLLVPANNPDVNLCKTLLGAYLLDYPTPTILAWGDTYESPAELGGGSHIAKISRVLDYLNALSVDQDLDLVLMVDAYDVWFQLRLETLLNRFNRLLRQSNERLQKRLGSAYDLKNLRQSILFAAGKRCAPNQLHTVACYPLPEPPTSSNLYGANTDTVIGRNGYFSTRQRYLNSGYIMGPVRDMRTLFQHAWSQAQSEPEHSPLDNGSGGSDFIYHGSDQSIFNKLFGEQEYMREVMRLDSVSWLATIFHPFTRRKPSKSVIQGAVIDNILDPSFTHEQWSLPSSERSDKRAREFGIFLDYSSDIGHQTVNSETDTRWLNFSQSPLEEQVHDRNDFDCPMNVPREIPHDISGSDAPFQESGSSWSDLNLYTHLCFGTIPVLVHHNGDKGRRETDWNQMWYTRKSQELFEGQQTLASASTDPSQSRTPGARTINKDFLSWSQLCPKEWDADVFDLATK
ncbi:MAG: hypothetical protein M1828_001734 [Chrysothrix sp. TS-e1954]|nr:MAG: hypothetical protein M1828_001734 [Chrysothrix sp. TS-e1954]